MKTLQQIKDAVAVENGCKDWKDLILSFHKADHEGFYDQATIVYSDQISQNNWIHISEGLPEQNTTVLVSDGTKVSDSWFGKRTRNDNMDFRLTSMKVTFWMPLPEVPKLKL